MGASDAQEPKTKKPRTKKNQPAASDVDVEVADANPQPKPEYIKGPAGAVVLVSRFLSICSTQSMMQAVRSPRGPRRTRSTV